MPRDGYGNADAREHEGKARRELAEFGRLVNYTSAHDPVSRDEAVRLEDWLNEVRSKAGKLAERIPAFRGKPRRGETDAIPLIAHVLSNPSEIDLILLRELAKCIGPHAFAELRRIRDTAGSFRVRANARSVLNAR